MNTRQSHTRWKPAASASSHCQRLLTASQLNGDSSPYTALKLGVRFIYVPTMRDGACDVAIMPRIFSIAADFAWKSGRSCGLIT